MSVVSSRGIQEVEAKMGVKIVPHPTVPQRYSVTLSWGSEEEENAIVVHVTMRIPETTSAEEIAKKILSKFGTGSRRISSKCRLGLIGLASE